MLSRCSQTTRQLHAVHVGHDHVDERDMKGLGPQRFQRCLTAFNSGDACTSEVFFDL